MNEAPAKEDMPPSSVDSLLQQALSHHQAGRMEDAVGLYCKVLNSHPDHLDALNFGGVAFFQSGENTQALEMLRKAVQLAPDYAEAHNNLGKVLHESGEVEDSLACFERALEIKPDYLEAKNNLGLALQDLGRAQEAAEAYRGILSVHPEAAEVMVNLSRALFGMKAHDEAEATIKRAIELWPHVVAYDNLAVIHMAMGRYDLAEAVCRQAIEADPGYAEAHNNLGVCLTRLGRDEEAAEAHLRALELAPEDIKLHYNYAQSHTFSADDPALKGLEELMDYEGVTEAQRGMLLFALGKAHDEAGKYDDAFSFYQRGNALMAEDAVFDRAGHHDLMASIKKAFAKAAAPDAAGETKPGPAPVFIVGLSRSGKTLVESLLSRHELVHGAGESPQWVASLEEVVEELDISGELPGAVCLLDEAQKRKAAAVFMEKIAAIGSDGCYVVNTSPENYLYVGMILETLPQAKVIYCRRDAVDTALSIFFSRYERGHAHAYDVGDIASYMAGYLDLMAHWQHEYGERVLPLRYEDLTETPEKIRDKVYEFCCLEGGGPRLEDMLTTEHRGRWKNYESHLGPMLEALREHELMAADSRGS
ncbi:MAG: tetratricopeptide repeat protein [Alphaproteobacteria bacterium]|nr:tetratricopeptide repeat protein [Alphaproteobacteria bacterium]